MNEPRKPLVALEGEALSNKLRELGLDKDRNPITNNPLEKEAQKMADSPVVAPVVKSGWKTTEFWLVTVLLGVLAKALFLVIAIVPAILAAPGMPPVASLAAGAITLGIGWIAKKVVAAYQAHRTELKLPPDPSVES